MKKEILLLISSVLFVFICLEAGLRIYKWPRTGEPGIEGLCKYDELLGWRGKPNRRIKTFSVEVDYNYNSRGWRDKEYTYKKPLGVKRIVVLGDSFTFGLRVEHENTFPKVLEQKLGDKYQVLSLGMTGYGTDQEFISLYREGLNYEPDVVILAFFMNDVYDNGTIAANYGRNPKPYFTVDSTGKLILNNIPVPYLKSPLRSIEFIKTKLWELKAILHMPSEYRKDVWGAALNPKYMSSRYWKLTVRLLWEINKLCRSEGIKFMITVIPLEHQITRMNDRLPQEVLLDFGKRTAIPVLDLLPYFEPYKSSGLYFSNDVHWNENGHYMAAQAIYDFLFKKRILPE